jgi:hypothetical protein
MEETLEGGRGPFWTVALIDKERERERENVPTLKWELIF